MDNPPVRDAATLILLRDAGTAPAVLMGQRGSSAAFLPGKFVFPGGAVDPADHTVPATALTALDATRLSAQSMVSPTAIAAAAIRELWEETGQIIGTPAAWAAPPQGWRGFAATGHVPNAAALQFFFRAVTPVGRPRRFDARFFLADAADLATDPDDFSHAEDELAHLHWVPLADAGALDLPFITQVVFAELIAHLDRRTEWRAPPVSVPFFQNNDTAHLVTRLHGQNTR